MLPSVQTDAGTLIAMALFIALGLAVCDWAELLGPK